jgi:GNAT superfamily N-acetyltransferase
MIVAASLAELDEAAALRGAMALEMGNDWDVCHPGWQSRFAAYWREKQISGKAQTFFARNGEATAGMAIASIADEYRGAALGELRGYVNGVFVVPELRRRGIARDLMVAALAWLREKKCVVVRLRASDQGRQLYTSLGFEAGREMELSLRPAAPTLAE